MIVHAPELLPLTLLWQWLGKGRQFIYDIQENYALNVSTQRVYRGLVRRGLAAGLRWVQGLAASRAAAVILAEASYADELPFLTALPPQPRAGAGKQVPAPARRAAAPASPSSFRRPASRYGCCFRAPSRS